MIDTAFRVIEFLGLHIPLFFEMFELTDPYFTAVSVRRWVDQGVPRLRIFRFTVHGGCTDRPWCKTDRHWHHIGTGPRMGGKECLLPKATLSHEKGDVERAW